MADKRKKQTEKQLGVKVRREIERALGVFLVKPRKTQRTNSEQIGVLNREEEHLGDLVAKKTFFTKDELVEKLLQLISEKDSQERMMCIDGDVPCTVLSGKNCEFCGG